MNEFYLINEINETFSLKDFQQKSFIPFFKGLGHQNDMSYVRVGNAFRLDKSEIAQGELTGTTIFKSYDNYQDFINYVEKSSSIRLVYKPLNTEYYRDIDFKGLTDTIKRGGTVEAELSLMCKGLYYTESDKRFTVQDVEGESRYDLAFDYTFNDYSNISIDYNNNGHTDAEMLVEIHGYIANPVIELYQSGKLVYSVSFTTVIETGQKLIYSSKDGDNYVVIEDTDGTQINAVNVLNLESDNFFKIPKGRSILRVSSDTGINGKVVFRILTAFKGV